MTAVKRHIAVSPAQRADLSKRFDVTPQMVGQALSYKKDTDKARTIRKAAKNDGCVEYLTAPLCETIHDANGFMRQKFDNGAEIEVNKCGGGGIRLFYMGKLVAYDPGVITINQLTKWQERATKLNKQNPYAL